MLPPRDYVTLMQLQIRRVPSGCGHSIADCGLCSVGFLCGHKCRSGLPRVRAAIAWNPRFVRVGLIARHGNQGQPQIAGLVDQAVERGLVAHRPLQRRVAVAVVRDGQAVEPDRPMWLQVAFNSHPVVHMPSPWCRWTVGAYDPANAIAPTVAEHRAGWIELKTEWRVYFVG